MKKAAAVLAALGLALGLAGCSLYPSKPRGVERLLIVQAMGIDAVGGVELSMVSSADSSRGEGPVRLVGRGGSVAEAQRSAAVSSAEEELFCAHTRYVLVGEKTAAERGLEDVLGFICRSPEIRIDVPVFVVRGASAKDALLHTGDDRVGAAEILSSLTDGAALPDAGSYSCARVSARLAEGKSALVYALSPVPSSEQTEAGELITLVPDGFGVINDGRLVGFVEAEDAVAVDLLCGSKAVHEFVLRDGRGGRVTLRTAPGTAVVRPIRDPDGTLRGVAADAALGASVLETDGGGDLADGEYRAALAAILERELLTRLGRVLAAERELGADFLGLGDRIALRSSSAERGRDGDFSAALGSLRFELSVSVSIDHSNDVRGQ